MKEWAILFVPPDKSAEELSYKIPSCSAAVNSLFRCGLRRGENMQRLKSHLQGQLYLPRSIRIGGLQGVSRNLEMTGIEINSQLVADFDEIRRIHLHPVF